MSDADARAVVKRALELDAQGQGADTLYKIGATIVANGRPRLSPPRFAGVGRGGMLTIQNIGLELLPPLAWGTVKYRWAARDGGAMEIAEATVVLERGPKGWVIVHAHSSLPVPWEGSR